MRIAFHVPRSSYLEPGFSGDKVYVRSLLAGLGERGHEVEIVSRLNVRDFLRGLLPAHRLVTEAISIWRKMKRFSPDAYLVYGACVMNPDLFTWWQCPKRYVLFGAYGGNKNRLPRWWRWFFVFSHHRSISRADSITVLCPIGIDDLGIPRERIYFIPPAVRTWGSVPSREEARRHIGLAQEATVILCISRFAGDKKGKGKGKVDSILDLLNTVALASLPHNFVLVIVGDGEGRKRLEEEIIRLQLQRYVRLVGSVEHEELVWYYAACDFFAFPDRKDMPRVAILEAQSCGRPVVTMHTRSAEFTVDPGRTGLLAKNLEEFQSHIEALASNRDLCRIMGQSAHEYIERFHSMGVRLSQIEDLLRNSSQGKKSGSP